MTCTFATVPAYPSEIKELASSVIDQSASPVINDPQPMIIDKSTLPVVEEPEQMTVDKSNLSIIDEPALPTVTLPMVDEPSPPTMTSPRVDKPAPSVVDKSSGTWSFNGIDNAELCDTKLVDSLVKDSSTAVPRSSS